MLKPLHECDKHGCNVLTRDRYCYIHKHTPLADIDRPNSNTRGYDYKWRKESKQHLRQSPWCIACLMQGTRTPATVVDHIKPHKGNKALFWNKANWQSLCKRCHGIKTVTFDGGFGR